jgi:NTE family protein
VKVGLALGGGGARGFAHILALEVLDAHGISPTIIAGTSMGSIIGALYASGLSGAQVRGLIDSHTLTRRDRFKDVFRKRSDLIQWLSFARPAWSRKGLFRADRVLRYLLARVDVETFEQLKIPLRVVSTDFHRVEKVVFDSGELQPALQASISIPGVFTPVEHEGRILVDGGVVDNLPYHLLFDECDLVIAVDVSASKPPRGSRSPTMLEAVLATFDTLVAEVTESAMQDRAPDIYVQPELGGILALDFAKIDEVFDRAKPAMEAFDKELTRLQL